VSRSQPLTPFWRLRQRPEKKHRHICSRLLPDRSLPTYRQALLLKALRTVVELDAQTPYAVVVPGTQELPTSLTPLRHYQSLPLSSGSPTAAFRNVVFKNTFLSFCLYNRDLIHVVFRLLRSAVQAFVRLPQTPSTRLKLCLETKIFIVFANHPGGGTIKPFLLPLSSLLPP
jgi:hypothetical protein